MATNHNINIPFLLDKKDIVVIKPSSPTPPGVLLLSTIDNSRHLEVLCQTIYVYQPRINNYPNGNNHSESDPACVLKEALSRVLVHYYPLAGKLKRHSDGKLRINCNADGVPFLEATANCTLSSLRHFDGIDVETAKQFVTDFPTNRDDGYHPLVLRVTKFSCGGFTIGMGLSHSVCDGFGATQFFRAMAELASGKSEPSVKPVWERERLVVSPTPSHDPIQFPVEASPYCPPIDVIHECFNVKSESIRRLKQSLMTVSSSYDRSNFTVVEALGAYVWRSRIRALELNPDEETIFILAMGIRNLLNPPLPDGYYGNAFVSSSPVVQTRRELDEGSLSRIAKLIKESKKIASNTEYILKELSVMETVRELNIEMESRIGGATMVLTDWRRLNLLEEVDFGWKGAVNIIPIPWDMVVGYMVDLCLLLPPCSLDATMEGGVRVLVSFPRAAMAKFKEEMNALEQLGDDDHSLI